MDHAEELRFNEAQDDVFCPTCTRKPDVVIPILDTRRGRTVRMFLCECGEIVWDDLALPLTARS